MPAGGPRHLRALRHLVVQRVHRLAIQTAGIAVDDLQISPVALLVLEAGEVVESSALQEGGAVFADAIQSAKKFTGSVIVVLILMRLILSHRDPGFHETTCRPLL